MDKIANIVAKIAADTQAEIDALTAQAEAEAKEVADGFQAQADALAQELAAKGAAAAAEREERMASVAQLEVRQVMLGAKQDMLDKAFDRALDKLCSLEDADYIDLLAELLVNASTTGKEKVVFSQKDRTRVGKAAVTRANDKANATLTLSEESRPMKGGFILQDGKVEVNCAFETLVRLQRTEMAGQVAKALFD